MMKQSTAPSLELSHYARQSIESNLKSLNSQITGLSIKSVKQRKKQYGDNSIETNSHKSIVLEYLKNFTNPLILTLLVISVISFFLGEIMDGLIVFFIVFFSSTLNFFQEHKANQGAKKLQEKVSLQSTVIRENKQQDIKSTELVPGDILVLNAGDLIPADCQIITAKDFFVNQSSITGESFPIEKNNLTVTETNTDISNLNNIIFAGTNVVTGHAQAIVIKTGKNTQFGNIFTHLANSNPDNNFTIGIKNFSYFVLRIVFIFVIFIFGINTLIKQDFLQSLTFAIAIAVGLTPEFLPMIMTVTMSKGALNMLKKGIIVKKMSAIPTFGSMNILCTDKTGTITEDKIQLIKYLNSKGETDKYILEIAYVSSIFQSGITNPLDEAIKKFKSLNINHYLKIDEIPYDFERKRMSVVTSSNNQELIITKGAPESIFEVSTHYLIDNQSHPLTSTIKSKLLNQYNQLSQEGFRVLAISTKPLQNKEKTYSITEEQNLCFCGFVAFLDPVKKNARLAIDKLEEIGIEIKVITGDNELVTRKACEEAGIEIKNVMLGHQINTLTDEELAIKAQNSTIFARFSPAQKNRVITALKNNNNVVGYMGDGINDAPSLKSADVGISVNNAVDIAKESADFILTKKSLIELSDGVREGRKIFGNTMKYILMSISSNFGNMFSVLGAVILLPFLPMLPIQILLNNFLYDISQITIPTDNVDNEYLIQPKQWDIGFIKKFMLSFGPISSVFDFATFGLMYYYFSNDSNAFQTGWFIMSLVTQTLVIHIIRTRKTPFIQSKPSKGLIASTLLVSLTALIIPYSPLSNYFGFTQLPVFILFFLGLLILGYLISAELGKRLFYKLLVQSN